MSAADALQAVHEPRERHSWRVLDQQMHMVILAIEFNQPGLEVFAHLCGGFADDFNGAIAEHPTPVLCDKDQMHM